MSRYNNGSEDVPIRVVYNMKRYIRSGIRFDNATYKYTFDFTLDLPDDIIDIVPPKLYKSSVRNHVYWFGYLFKDTVSSKQRSDFLHAIKEPGNSKIANSHLRQFIELPLGELDDQFGMYNIDCLVYPISNRSKLVNKIVSIINSYTSHDKHVASYPLVKSIPTEIGFDWESFDSDNKYDLNKYNQMRKYVETNLLPAIRELDYFSLAENVKPKYRKYIKNYLGFLSQDDLSSYAKAQGQNILVVDDINTSGSTIDEILKILDTINRDANIFVFTLIGNM